MPYIFIREIKTQKTSTEIVPNLLSNQKHHVTKKGGLPHKTNLNPPHFIEVPVPAQQSERSCICVYLIFHFNIFNLCA